MTKSCLKDQMERAGLKQADLARMTGVNKATVSRWASGRVSAEAAVRIEGATRGAISRSALRPDLWPSPRVHAHEGDAA